VNVYRFVTERTMMIATQGNSNDTRLYTPLLKERHPIDVVGRKWRKYNVNQGWLRSMKPFTARCSFHEMLLFEAFACVTWSRKGKIWSSSIMSGLSRTLSFGLQIGNTTKGHGQQPFQPAALQVGVIVLQCYTECVLIPLERMCYLGIKAIPESLETLCMYN